MPQIEVPLPEQPSSTCSCVCERSSYVSVVAASSTRAARTSSEGVGKGGSAAIAELIDEVGAKASMVKEDGKLFLSVDALPRYV